MPPKNKNKRGKNQQHQERINEPQEEYTQQVQRDYEMLETARQRQQMTQRDEEQLNLPTQGFRQQTQGRPESRQQPQQGRNEFSQQSQSRQEYGREPLARQESARQPQGQQEYGWQSEGRQEFSRQPQGRQPQGRQPQGQQEYVRQPQGRQPQGRQPQGQQEFRQEPRQQPQGRQEFGQPPQGRQELGQPPQGRQELGQPLQGRQEIRQPPPGRQELGQKPQQKDPREPDVLISQTQKGPEVFKPESQPVQQPGPRTWKYQPPENLPRGASGITFQRDQSQTVSSISTDVVKGTPQIHPQKIDGDLSGELSSKLSTLSIGSSGDVKHTAVDTAKPDIKEAPGPSTSTTRQPQKFVKLQLKYNISPTVYQKFLPKRPDEGGRQGRKIELIINCLNMKINPMKIYMYNIDLTKAEVTVDNKHRDVTPKMNRKETLREVVYEFLKDKGGVPVFDGGKIIFSNKMLQIDNNTVNKVKMNFNKDGEVVVCHFDLQRVKEVDIDLSDVTHYVTSKTGRSDTMPQEALRALDTIIKEMFVNKNLIAINRRAIFDPKSEKPLRCGPYLLLDGYSTTVRPHMWSIRFNFDKTQIVIHKPMNLYDYIGQLTDNFRRFNPDVIKKKIHLLRVEANHFKKPDGKNYSRKYTIHGFSRGNATQEKIEEKDITIEKYFFDEYKIKLKYPQYQLIKTSPNKKTYVPMELLQVLPHQKVLANDPAIVQEVIRHAAIPPFDRLTKLKDAIRTLKFGDRADKFIKNYMIEIDENLINVSGRILESPEAKFDGRPVFLRGGKWDIRGKKFFQPHSSSVNWALFAVGSERDYSRNDKPLYDIEDMLPGAARNVGVTIEKMYHFQYIPWQKIEIEVPNIITSSEKDKKRLDLLVFVINRDEDYKAVKRFGDMTFGIATQCMKYATLQRQKGMDQYLGNIMLKINTKLGGINWELMALINKNFSPIKGRFMVFGIDVTHPASTRNDLSKSIAAMVGSLDNTASLYSAVIRQQVSKEERSIVEVVLDTDYMVHKLLMTFYTSNKQLKPEHLIFYRDGVSEGQFEIVFRHEIIAIQDACTKLQADYQPKITYIVVQKRHKIRFFPTDQRDAIGKSGNVPAGTVVDKDITHCREFDFYLCSHEGIQGTSKPAHYHVLYDDNNWGSDDLQSFTYFLCHVYARSTRSVSYPAPTYYAHLAAFRGRALIGELSDDSSSTTSGQTQKTTDSSDSEISIHDYHDNKLFFI